VLQSQGLKLRKQAKRRLRRVRGCKHHEITSGANVVALNASYDIGAEGTAVIDKVLYFDVFCYAAYMEH
jgi:hypothetical protein